MSVDGGAGLILRSAAEGADADEAEDGRSVSAALLVPCILPCIPPIALCSVCAVSLLVALSIHAIAPGAWELINFFATCSTSIRASAWVTLWILVGDFSRVSAI